ncbi:Hypothetical predicted protein [Pelobates cultripes]|uniref:Uncharacterized protein n=1 Tax=Pelobates cultripes TaxID=61616 RepID=A0AAD1W3K7_PELCU|nr:Hypothetical predicted protein [Pelobates cultripes]
MNNPTLLTPNLLGPDLRHNTGIGALSRAHSTLITIPGGEILEQTLKSFMAKDSAKALQWTRQLYYEKIEQSGHTADAEI